MARIMWIGLWVLLAQAAAAQDWDARIAAARARAAEIETYAGRYGYDYNSMGAIMRYVDTGRVRCLVLADMVGLGDISHYQEFAGVSPVSALPLPGPDIVPNADTLLPLLWYAWNLNDWARTAEDFLKYSDDQRAETWELNCNGQDGIPDGLLPAAWNTQASFRLDGTTLNVLGDITPGFFEAFKAALDGAEVKVIALGSRGGSVQDAMEAGGLIRQRGMTPRCAAIAIRLPVGLFGGKTPRVLYQAPLPRLGFHQVSTNGVAIPLDSPIYDLIGGYVAAMGVDADFVLATMKSTPPEGMFFPDYQAYCAAHFVDWAYQACNWPPTD
ncbi:MAG: hypothetical protein R3D80_04830 [Paracoccaceae bacterium]